MNELSNVILVTLPEGQYHRYEYKHCDFNTSVVKKKCYACGMPASWHLPFNRHGCEECATEKIIAALLDGTARIIEMSQ